MQKALNFNKTTPTYIIIFSLTFLVKMELNHIMKLNTSNRQTLVPVYKTSVIGKPKRGTSGHSLLHFPPLSPKHFQIKQKKKNLIK